MFQYPVGRIVESERIAGFLRAVESWPAALVLDGEAGIGKSTVWQSTSVSHITAAMERLGCDLEPSGAAPMQVYGAAQSVATLRSRQSPH